MESDQILAERRRATAGYAGISTNRIQCVKFKPLQTVREAWLERYYDDDDLPDGWDEDVEANVNDIKLVPQWVEQDSDSE